MSKAQASIAPAAASTVNPAAASAVNPSGIVSTVRGTSSSGMKSPRGTNANSNANAASTMTNNNAGGGKRTGEGWGKMGKNHQLEGDGLITGFYGFLAKRDTKEMKGCQDVWVPDTIVYTNNFPRGWYFTDKSAEVMQKPGVDLDSSKVYEYFRAPVAKNVGIVASYMSVTESEDVTTTHVEFFNERTLKEFVERKQKAQGILQRFVVPKGGARNTVVQAVWSPRVLCVWRRQNRLNLTSGPQAEKDPYPMCVTYDGPSHHSEESTCASNTSVDIKDVCSTIVRHFYHTMEHKFLTRMVLYFKIDEFEKPWLLWCGSLRVADRTSLEINSLNFAPRYDNATMDAIKEMIESDRLSEMDHRYVELAHDKLFTSKYINHHGGSSKSPPGTARSASNAASLGLYGANASSAHTRSNLLGNLSGTSGSQQLSPNSTARGNRAAAFVSGDDGLNLMDSPESLNNTVRSSAKGSHQRTLQQQQEQQQQLQNERDAWHRNPQIHDAYIELCAARDKVLSHLDDIFYEAYGHFLKYKPGNFVFFVEKAVARTLGIDALGEAMLTGGISKATPSADLTNVEDEDLCFEIPALTKGGPVSKIGDSVKHWVNTHYARLIADLKDEAASLMPAGGGNTSRKMEKEHLKQREDLGAEEKRQRQLISTEDSNVRQSYSKLCWDLLEAARAEQKQPSSTSTTTSTTTTTTTTTHVAAQRSVAEVAAQEEKPAPAPAAAAPAPAPPAAPAAAGNDDEEYNNDFEEVEL